MTIVAYTSFSFSYLDRARVLAHSLKDVHSDWQLWAVITDKHPVSLSIDWTQEPFDRIIYLDELIGDQADKWIFGHTIVEACTAVKAAAANLILSEEECEKLLYFDPDIAVFNSLENVIDLLDVHSIILTPHQTCPVRSEKKQAIIDNEICSLSHGAYNLGFIAMSNCPEARRFCKWWDERLRDWCHDRKEIGIFVDQKWCDLVPSFFDDVMILRDPGYNVASWNLDNRKMKFDNDGLALINGHPLRFFHFTKLGPVGDSMTKRYAGMNFEIYELWAWYKRKVEAHREDAIPENYWHYGSFDNGVAIPPEARALYRERSDLNTAFSEPFSVKDGFYGWILEQTEILDGAVHS
jgi:hypothetical protein